LIENGQIEILGGGWSANDEACPYYEDIVENMTGGMQWIWENLGVVPKVGWQLDSFGHSSTNARIFAKLGFKFLVFSRIDAEDRRRRFREKNLKFIWNPQGSEQSIFTEITTGNYCEPNFLRSREYKPRKFLGQKFYEYLRKNSRYYKENRMMQLLGCDFMYQDAKFDYSHYWNVAHYINQNPKKYPKIQLKYSLVSEY
jgi:lysosomal alpha-mannosidase